MQSALKSPGIPSTGIAQILTKYCGKCHGPDVQEADIDFQKLLTSNTARVDRDTWMKADEMLLSQAMPPSGEPTPSSEDRTRISQWIRATFAAESSAGHDPGHVTFRRLNRAEYDNTIRDLVGLDLHLARDFPSDDVGEGFDNIGDVLSLPPLLFEKYLDAAERIAEAAILAEPPTSKSQRRERQELRGDGSAQLNDWRPEELPESHRRILISQPSDTKPLRQAAGEILERFATRAFRRPVKSHEVEPFVNLVQTAVQQGDSFERGIQVAVTAVLVSPHFLFRVEPDDTSTDAPVRPLNGYELASRLSYFLWSTMPDELLFSQAAEGELQREDILREQTLRMLHDPKAEALVSNFGGQWLNLRNLDEVTPDPQRYAAFDRQLRRDMQQETEMFFAAVMREDRSIFDFLTGDFTFVNERLAKHYGWNSVQGDQFQRVRLADGHRIGVLTHASILTPTSNPTRTSPVKRGKWIMENILGTRPPDPPPNVPTLEESQKAAPQASLREQMLLHRQNPVCAACHLQMDEIGFGFENFDPIGRWRETEGSARIDATGKLPSGESFSGPSELVRILAQRRRAFSETLTRKLLTYALGRGLRPPDDRTVQGIVDRLEKGDDRFSSLVLGIVFSQPFRMR